MTVPPAHRSFRSFWIAGFECSCHINSAGKRLDMTAAIQHDICAEADYAMLRGVGIRTARDGVRWHLVDRGGRYDFSSFAPMVKAAREHGVQVIWDLCHYGWPDDLDIFSAVLRRPLRAILPPLWRAISANRATKCPYFAPVNEINFFAWAATRDLMYPYACGRDGELKRQLVRAAIASAEAILRRRSAAPAWCSRADDPQRAAAARNPGLTEPARRQHDSQYEAWDMIAGTRRARNWAAIRAILDVIGVNYYAANQWEVPGGRKLHWDAGSDDPRWVPLPNLLAEVYQRYQRPIFMAETSHYGTGRAAWLREVADGVCQALGRGHSDRGRLSLSDPGPLRLGGYQRIGTTAASGTSRSYTDGCYERVLNKEYAHELAESQKRLKA